MRFNVEVPGYVLSTIGLSINGVHKVYRAGTLITDANIASLIYSAGSLILPAFLVLYQQAASRCLSAHTNGASDFQLDTIMRDAVATYLNGYQLVTSSPAMLAGDDNPFQSLIWQVPTKLTLTDAFFIIDTQPAIGETDVRSIQINLVTVPNTSVVCDVNTPTNQRIFIPNVYGTRLNRGDQIGFLDVYTPGSTPNLAQAECTTVVYAI